VTWPPRHTSSWFWWAISTPGEGRARHCPRAGPGGQGAARAAGDQRRVRGRAHVVAKARALTRIATPDTEAGLADLGGPMTAAQLERFVAAHRKVTRADDERARLLTIVPYPHDRLDLHIAIWACLANARVAAEQRAAQAARRDQQLAA
jgi:hypothetical protein